MKKVMDIEKIIIPVSFASVTMLSGAFLLSNKTHADDVVSTATITVPVACTMSGTGTESHTATIPNGTVQENIGTTTMKVYCNDSEGFSIYAAGFSDDTLGNTFLRDSTLGNSDDILTGTTFTGTSQWAMKIGVTAGTYPSTIAGSEGDSEKQSGDTDYSTWAEIPSSYTRVAYRNSGTDVDNVSAASAEGSSITATYKAFINSTQKAGTYVGKVKFTMVHPASEEPLTPVACTPGYICYSPNASDVEGTMGMQRLEKEKDWSSCNTYTDYSTICVIDGNPVDIYTLPELDTYIDTILLASNFSRTGYGFAGWSDAYDYATNPNANFYGPQETITAPVGTTANGLSLYAVWIKSAGNLQDTAKVAELCGTGTKALTPAPTDGTANLSSVSALTDQRDNETYAIAKLADGNCWMIENLRLESTAEHNSDGTLSQGYGGQFAGLAAPETPDKFTPNNVANSLYSDDGTNDTINIGVSLTAYRMPRYNNINTPTTASDRPQNPTSNSATNTTSNASMYSYGNYYSWHAAIADTTAYASNNTSVTNTSICPAGWRLPQGGDKTRIESDDDNDFWNLTVDALNNGTTPANYSSSTTPYYSSDAEAGPADKKLRSYPNNFVYSGYVNSGSVLGRGARGDFWSSTAILYDLAYYLDLYSSIVGPGTYSDLKYNGGTVRCVASGV